MRIELTRRAFVASGLAALAAPLQAEVRAYELVAERSDVTFIFTAGGTRQTGTLPVSTAEIFVNTGDLVRSSAEVTADIRNIRAGVPFVADAIKSPDLLDAANHPIVRFTSNRIRLGAQGRISDGATIEGDLTLRGVMRPIALNAVLTRPADSAADDLSLLTIRLNGTLSRRDFGATGYAALADDRVDLDIRAEIKAMI
jgi:polyisoprenoid-binding protein YceI